MILREKTTWKILLPPFGDKVKDLFVIYVKFGAYEHNGLILLINYG